MYFLDPARGRRRRAMAKDKLVHAARLGTRTASMRGRDLAHRASGAVARVRSVMRWRGVDDGVLAERVRARVGRVVSRARGIQVDAFNRCVTLRGAVLERDAARLLQAVKRVPGVRSVVNMLRVYDTLDRVPSLRGVA